MTADPPLLMQLHDIDMQALGQVAHAETGMNFQVVVVPDGPIAVLSDGSGLPCFKSVLYYDLSDLLAGSPVPQPGAPNFSLPAVYTVISRRLQIQGAIAAAATGGTASGGGPSTGAYPLLTRRTLTSAETFLRYISAPTDRRFTGLNLLPGTYLTTDLESKTASSGFAAVGRFALPLPVPACNVIQYELSVGTVIDAGTVAPLFGQSGGGVEVCVVSSPSVRRVGSSTVPEY